MKKGINTDVEIDEIVFLKLFNSPYIIQDRRWYTGGGLNNYFQHRGLYVVFYETIYCNSWDRFWSALKPNTGVTTDWFDHEDYDAEEEVLLRLLVVEEFKKWLKGKHGKKTISRPRTRTT